MHLEELEIYLFYSLSLRNGRHGIEWLPIARSLVVSARALASSTGWRCFLALILVIHFLFATVIFMC